MSDETEPGSENVYTSLRALTRLRYTAQGFNYLPQQPVRSILSGRKRSRLRGRGLDFDELRHYLPGDDIRNMDWRVTNRTGKPHVRVYSDERDRPVIVAVDQRLSMFFGSQLKMKSVVAAEVAAITAWRVLSVGDRVGALLFNDHSSMDVKPTRNDKRVIGWLGELTRMNNALAVDRADESSAPALTTALETLARRVGHDYLVVLISDFYGWNDQSLGAIRRISQHNDVVCAQIYDPLEKDISTANNLIVSDGQYQLEINPEEKGLGEKFEASFRSSTEKVQSDLRRYQIPVLPIDTVTPATAQLREKLGGGRRQS